MSLWSCECGRHDYGQIQLATPEAEDLVVASQYYKIPGVFTASDCGRFECTTAGVLTYKGRSGIFQLSGVSDVQVDKACTITYGLYLNAALVPEATTPHTFLATSKISNISIVSLIELVYGDDLEVYAKSDTSNTLLSLSTLRVTLFGAKY